jgi:hypothetical protein
MPEYLLSMHYDDAETPSEAELEPVMKEVAGFNDALRRAGAWVFTGGLHPASTATVVRSRDGDVVTTDGPYLETKEHLGGFWAIDAPDLDAALDWARQASGILLGLAIEVRPLGHCSTD